MLPIMLMSNVVWSYMSILDEDLRFKAQDQLLAEDLVVDVKPMG